MTNRFENLRSIPGKVYHFFTKTRLRKVLSATLAVLIVLNSIVFVFRKPTEVKAADVLLGFNEGYGTSVSDTNSTITSSSITNAVWKTEDLCKFGKCLYFDGTGDYVSHADDANLNMAASDTVTIELWFRTPDITSGTRTLVSKYETTGADGGYRIEMNSSGQIVFGIDNNNTSFPLYSVTSSGAYDDNAWHHIAAVKDGTSSMTLYIDAASVGTTSIASTDASNNDTFYVGIYNGSSNGFLGFIDEVKVLRTARTATEIKSDFLQETPSRGTSASFGPDQSYLSDGLVGYWKMDENTGQYIYDSSGNGISGTLGADASSSSDDMSWSSGKYGSGLTSDGVADYAKIPDNDALDVQTGDMTVSAWFKTNGDHTSYVVTKDGCGNTNDWLIGVEANGQTSFRLIGDTDVSISHGSSSTLNTWHQVVGVKNGTVMQIYFDGALKNSATAPTGLAGNSQPVYIAARGGSISNPGSCSYPLPGSVDDVRIYNRALSPDEVSALYNWAPGPVGYWNFDEGSGGTAYDTSANDNAATQPWYQSWQYRKKITIDHTKVTATQSNFPVLINLSSDSELAASACNSPSAGYDILFTSSDKTTKLSHEIEKFDDSTGELVAWVKVSSLSSTSDTILYMYYGNGACSNQQDTVNVWSNYVGVWHLKESSGSGYYILNSVQNNYHANAGSTTYVSSAKIDGGRDMAANYMTVQNGTDLLDSDTAFTFQFWAYPDYATDSAWQSAGEDQFENSQSFNLCRWWRNSGDAAGTGTFQCDVTWTDHTDYAQVSGYLLRQQWNLVVFTYDGSNLRIYVNGTQRYSQSDSSKTLRTNDHLYFGGSSSGIDSNVDEFRYARSYRDANWIATEYNNQYSPSTFSSLGGEEPNVLPWRTGKFGSAINFNGSSNSLTVNDSNSLDLNTSFTVSLWLKSSVSSIPANEYIYSKTDDSGGQNGIILYLVGGGKIGFMVPSKDIYTQGSSITDTNWHHIAWVFEGSTSMRTYLDGTLNYNDTSSVPANASPNAYNLKIGQHGDGTDYFSGTLDNISVYNYARTPAQIVEDMNAGHPAPGSPIGSPVGYWKFDDMQGDAAQDNSANNNDGDLGGSGQTCPATGTVPCPLWSNSGKFGGDLDFDGSDDYATIADNNIFDFTTDWSITGWIKPTNNGQSDRIVTKMVGADNTGYDIMLWGGKMNPMIDGATSWDRVANLDYYGGEWAYFAWVKSGTYSAVYKNGVLDKSWSDAPSADTNSENIKIGGAFGYMFDGEIDEIKIYNFALTDDQIKADMNIGSSASFGNVADHNNEGFGGNPPVGWWKLDEGSWNGTSGEIKDSSGNNVNLTAGGGSVPVPGKFGNGGLFDGSNDYLTVADNSTLEPANNMSWGAWVKFKVLPTQTTESALIVQKNYNATPWLAYGLSVLNGSNGVGVYWTNSSVTNFSDYSKSHLNANTWYHLMAVRNGSSLKIYINGVDDTDTGGGSPTGTLLNTAQPLFVGSDSGNSGRTNGIIDDVRIYDYALSPAQVAYIYNRGAPVGWWKFDDCQGATAYDSSGNGYNGTIYPGDSSGNNDSVGTCNSGASDPTNEMWNAGTVGKRNASLDFDGTNDYVDCADAGRLNLVDADFTIGAWVKSATFDTTGNWQRIIYKGETSAKGYSLSVTNYNPGGAYFIFGIRDNGGTYHMAYSSGGKLLDTWYYVVGVYSSGVLSVYTNGQYDTGSDLGGTPTVNTATNFQIGQRGDNLRRFDGQIDEVKVWNYALTPDQIKREYNNGAAFYGPATGSP